jgi:hypothetical protein
MNLKTVTVADLKPHPQNPNTHPEKQITALGGSLDEFDQVKNVVVWNGTILAGHALVTAAMKTGRLTLEAVDVSHWPEDKATAFMLADIRLPDMAIMDEAAMVEALRGFDAPLDIPGFDEDFLAGIEGPTDSQWEELFSGLPDGEKSPYTQMTFTLHDTQVQQVKDALTSAKQFGEFDYENKNSNGNALTRICEAFLTNGQS